ncbi:MAG: class I SAM-dependent methyltransferase [Actinomycetota bacterium]
MTEVNFEVAMEFTEKVFGYMQGAVVSALVHLGDSLGLYKAMQDAGPLTSTELAERTGLQERWVREWLRNQGAAELVTYRGEDRFELTPEQAAVLADEDNSVLFSAGGFGVMTTIGSVLDPLRESFRTGVGLPYDAQGESGNHAVARMFAPWFRHMLVPMILPALDGVTDKLAAGAKVADVGCGAGIALITMAQAFPKSDFHGFELSQEALALAAKNKAEAGAQNVTFHDVRGESLPDDGSFDFVTTFDCIHDMTHPTEVIAAIRRAIKDDGTYLIADINAQPTYEKNIEENPMTAMMYGFSVLSCMSSALSEPDGEGLGTLGFHEGVARDKTATAGFTRFKTHDFGNPLNMYYEVRP